MNQIKGDPDDKEAAIRIVLNKIQLRGFQIAEQIFPTWEKGKLFQPNRNVFSFQMPCFDFVSYITFLTYCVSKDFIEVIGEV